MKKLAWYTLGFLAVVLLIGAGVYWYGLRAGWFLPPLPSNPPTADELARLREIEAISNTQAETKVGGVGVRPPGSTPPSVGTSTATTTATSTPEEIDTTSGAADPSTEEAESVQ